MITQFRTPAHLSEGALADDFQWYEVVYSEARALQPQELCLLGGVRHPLLLLRRLRYARLGAQGLLKPLQSGNKRAMELNNPIK